MLGISFGTDNSTGGWTGYTGHYNDGSATAFNKGGISCTSTTNARWANYYADHQGDLDDSLLVLLDRATRKLHFTGPTSPETLPGPSNSKFSLYSNDSVIGNLNLLYAKADDQMGYRIGSHFGVPTFKNMPFEYVDILDTADTDTYGTDPIIGINHELIYPVVHSSWDFKVSKPTPRDDNHLVLSTYIDLQYCVVGEQLRHAGFLINQQ